MRVPFKVAISCHFTLTIFCCSLSVVILCGSTVLYRILIESAPSNLWLCVYLGFSTMMSLVCCFIYRPRRGKEYRSRVSPPPIWAYESPGVVMQEGQAVGAFTQEDA